MQASVVGAVAIGSAAERGRIGPTMIFMFFLGHVGILSHSLLDLQSKWLGSSMGSSRFRRWGVHGALCWHDRFGILTVHWEEARVWGEDAPP